MIKPIQIEDIVDELLESLRPLQFGNPVSHVYNPLEYARLIHSKYWTRYGRSQKDILLLGMNPGPWGMAQTGVPFGDVEMVRDWLKLKGKIDQPFDCHPKRPVLGFDCRRGEVSGRRLWGWAKQTFKSPDCFFSHFMVINYCPLIFMDSGGRNITPDKLSKKERNPIIAACDQALIRTVQLLKPKWVVGIGVYAATRAVQALKAMQVRTGRITHPSPANPKANKGWAALADQEFADQGILMNGKQKV
ncbi:MAG: single-strand selective monofunctional uracil-DNA glycosylase [Desulfobacteraceae bacterium]|nr:single-strand selective monofunctional uracil-DNA glycosylase [Desulfobacteraceae bacterium]